MFHPAIYENSRPDGIGILEITPGESEPRRGFVPLKRSELRGEIVGPLADLRLRQIFGYTSEQSPQTLEAIYRFPLPGDAAVTNVTVRFGDVEIVALLAARDAAEAEYEAAKQQGQQAALAKREAPDLFTLQVTGLQPDQAITVETRYIQLARQESSHWTIRIPLTTAPRYIRADERGSQPIQGQPLALLRDPGHRFSLDLHLHGVQDVNSPTHDLAVTVTEGKTQGETDGKSQVQLKAGEVIPDRDCVLTWRSVQAEQQPKLSLFLQESVTDAQRYFLAQVAPPHRPQHNPLPREVILLVDHSGSMTGPKWTAADWAVEGFLATLQEQDCFALGIFHNETRWFTQTIQSATPEKTAKAIAWLKQSSDSGGTELGVALEGALRLPHTTGEVARHLLILTDAAVTDGARILRLADQEEQRAARHGQRRRISVICIDAAPNAFLALELAERGGGVAKFLTSDPEQEDITTALDEVLAAWAEPLYVGLQLQIHHPQAELSGQQTILQRMAQKTVVDLGDLTGGQSKWIVGRVPSQATDLLTVELQTADGSILDWQQSRSAVDETSANLRALFGARRINGLEYLMQAGLPAAQMAEQLARLGYDPSSVLTDQTEQPTVYAETARAQDSTALRALLIAEALRYGLASAETAFVATRQEAGKPVQGQVAVANALPAGWSDHFLAGGPPLTRTMAMMPMAAMPAPTMHLASGVSRSVRSAPMALSAPLPVREGPTTYREKRAGSQEAVVFRGEVRATQGNVLLYTSTEEQTILPEEVTITGISLRLLTPAGETATPDRALALHLFVGDLASPRARIRLPDLLRQGQRPLNLHRPTGQPVELHLVDPNGWLQSHPMTIELVLHW